MGMGRGTTGGDGMRLFDVHAWVPAGRARRFTGTMYEFLVQADTVERAKEAVHMHLPRGQIRRCELHFAGTTLLRQWKTED